MTLKGEYSDLVSYSVGDVVRWTDSTSYVLLKPASSGTPPTDTFYWNRIDAYLQDAVDLILDAIDIAQGGALAGKVANNLTTTASGKVLDARQGKALKGLIDDITEVVTDAKTLVLASSTASSTKKFEITVDDSGELSVDEITEGGGT